jgi:hypothetical protein
MVACACALLAGCSGASHQTLSALSTGDSRPAGGSRSLAVHILWEPRNARYAPSINSGTLRCPAGGTFARAAAICKRIAAARGLYLPQARPRCLHGHWRLDIPTLRVTGTWDGRAVRLRLRGAQCISRPLRAWSHLLGGPDAVVPPPRFVPYQIGFWSATRGIALNRSGRSIATTADGGRTWRILRRWNAPVWSLSVASGGVAAVLGDCRVSIGCRRMWIWRGKRRGWTSRALPWPASMLVLAGASRNTAWARVGAIESPFMSLEATHDGGRHWHALGLHCPNGWTDNSPMSLPTPARGWMICTSEPGVGSQPKQLYQTSDGGATSVRLIDIHVQGSQPQLTRGLTSSGYPSALSMTADGHGLLAMGREFSWRTSDGGRHWLPLRSITSPDVREGFAVDQLSAATALMLVWSGDTGTTLYRTSDGDLHWSVARRWRP